MRHSFYTEQKQFFVYALRGDEEYIYVGKSTCRRPSAIFSAHVNGHYGATRHYFQKTGPNRPAMYLLEQKEMTASEAYKHVVAWVHVFINAGFRSINAEGVEEDARTLVPETQRIVQRIMQEPLDHILQRTRLDKPSDADRVKEESVATKQTVSKTKLSIRLTQGEKDRFDLFAKTMGLNQRQAFLYLLESAEKMQNDSQERRQTDSIRKVINDYQRCVDKLQQNNKQLQQKVQVLNSKKEKECQSEMRDKDRIQFMRSIVARFLAISLSSKMFGCPLNEYSYREFKKRFPDPDKYEYPKPGQILLQLEAIVWGKGRGVMYFVLGTDENGRRYKIRVYPKDWYIGVHIHQSSYAIKGSYWLLGCQKAKDGAVDLVGAFPVVETSTAFATEETQNKKMPLSEKILRAQEMRIGKQY